MAYRLGMGWGNLCILRFLAGLRACPPTRHATHTASSYFWPWRKEILWRREVWCQWGWSLKPIVNRADGPLPELVRAHTAHVCSLLSFSRSVVCDSLRPHGPQHARLPCPSPTPRAYSNSGPSSRWCHPSILVLCCPVSSCPQPFPASGSFLMKRSASGSFHVCLQAHKHLPWLSQS